MPSKVTVLLLLLVLWAPLVQSQQNGKSSSNHGGDGSTRANKLVAAKSDQSDSKAANQASKNQRIVSEGIVVEFAIEPLAPKQGAELLEGTEAQVRFTITDSHTGQRLGNLRPTAWIDLKRDDSILNDRRCRQKIQSFLEPSFSHRADIDLNTYFVLTLNHEPNISVIDPLAGFGGSKLYTLIPLKGPGEDWLMTSDEQRLFVAIPSAGEVAVIDTKTWKVTANIFAGFKPTRLALQHDGKYLWIDNEGSDAAGRGVTVIDAATLKVVAQLDIGAGQHDITFTDDDRYAFITNKQRGTLHVINVPKLTVLKEIKVGSLPSAVAFSQLSNAVYVINAGDGDVVVIDARRHEILTRIKTMPGLKAIRFPPSGRFGFVVNQQADVVYVFDASTNILLHTVSVGRAPDQISLTKNFAYVRSSGDEFVTMINLASLNKKGGEAAVTRFPAGQKAPKDSPYTSVADAIVAAPEDGAVLVANPADKMIYYYMEGMAAPMGSFQNYRRDPKAVLVLEKGLRENSTGVYSTIVSLTGHGRYDIAFLLDSPRVVNCFEAEVKENPALAKQKELPIRIETVSVPPVAIVGSDYEVRFKVIDTKTNQSRSDLGDMGMLAFLAPGIWQERGWASKLADGSYKASFVPPQAGVYYIFFQCPSLGIQFNQLAHLTIQAKERTQTPVQATQPQKP